MALIYFSRSRPAHPMAAQSLVSGVVDADGIEEAKTKLGALLKSGFTTVDEFEFTDIAKVPPQAHGVLVITMRQD